MYNEKVLEIFRNPQNMGRITKADTVGVAGDVADGDLIKLFIRLEGDTIAEATFETFGCVAAIVSSAIATDLLKGKTLDQALKIKAEDIIKVVDELPVGKEHGAELVVKAIENAKETYLKRQLKDGKISDEEYKKLTTKEKPKKAKKEKPAKKEKSKKVKKANKQHKDEVVKEVKQQPVEEPKKEEPQKETPSVNKLMLLTKKITKTTTTKNAAK